MWVGGQFGAKSPKGIGGMLGRGPVRFVEAFKHFRNEGVATVRDTTLRLIPSTDLWRRDGDADPPGGWQSEGQGQDTRGYHRIQSDVEDDLEPRRLSKVLPVMPKMDATMRQRTLKDLSSRGPNKAVKEERVFEWVNDEWFQWLSGSAIVANAAVVGLDTEFTDAPFLVVAEQALLLFFCVELTLRMAHESLDFFVHEEDSYWNMFDASVVLVGVFDQWATPVLRSLNILPRDDESAQHNVVLQVCTVLKYLRIIRLFRLVRIIKPLYQLAQGVVEALQGMFWVLVFVVMTLYTMAILCTRMIGHGDVLSEDLKDDPDIKEIQGMFRTVQDSMFTLFGTVSSWSLMRFTPLFEEQPYWKPILVCFYVYAAWGLIAVMCGVVSENMIAIREQLLKEDEKREAVRKTMITNLLIEVFAEADSDHSGSVTKAEFDLMLKSKTMIEKLTKNSNMKVQDLQDLFEWLDHDGSGTITIDEFMTGFKWVNEPLRSKSLVKLQERLLKDLYGLEKEIQASVHIRVDQVHKLVSAPLRKVHAITEQMQSLDIKFSRLRTTLQGQVDSTITEEHISKAEGRLMGKINHVLKTLERLDPDKPRQPIASPSPPMRTSMAALGSKVSKSSIRTG